MIRLIFNPTTQTSADMPAENASAKDQRVKTMTENKEEKKDVKKLPRIIGIRESLQDAIDREDREGR